MCPLNPNPVYLEVLGGGGLWRFPGVWLTDGMTKSECPLDSLGICTVSMQMGSWVRAAVLSPSFHAPESPGELTNQNIT